MTDLERARAEIIKLKLINNDLAARLSSLSFRTNQIELVKEQESFISSLSLDVKQSFDWNELKVKNETS